MLNMFDMFNMLNILVGLSMYAEYVGPVTKLTYVKLVVVAMHYTCPT